MHIYIRRNTIWFILRRSFDPRRWDRAASAAAVVAYFDWRNANCNLFIRKDISFALKLRLGCKTLNNFDIHWDEEIEKQSESDKDPASGYNSEYSFLLSFGWYTICANRDFSPNPLSFFAYSRTHKKHRQTQSHVINVEKHILVHMWTPSHKW